MYTQLRQPDLGITYKGGWCLDAVRRAYGIGAKYGTAMADWNSGNKRHEPPPRGFSVPVYFSLGNEPAGHIAISLPDGKVASSTQAGTHKGLYIHPNLNDLIRIYSVANKGCTYLGWSTEVNDVKVIDTGGSTMTITVEDYVSDIMDVIEDNPHYATQKPEAYKNHVAYVKTLDWAGRRAWVKDIMRNNGVLNATQMRQHLEQDKQGFPVDIINKASKYDRIEKICDE